MTARRTNDSSIDHALALLLADETDAALRWGAGVVRSDPEAPAALVVTSRLLLNMGRTRAATDGLQAALWRAMRSGDLPLAIAVLDDLRQLGVDVGEQTGVVAAAFCEGSPRVDPSATAPLLPVDELRPLSPFLAGPALASEATRILRESSRALDEGMDADAPPRAALPLFGALPFDALSDLLEAFRVITVAAGHPVVEEGHRGAALYVLARGQVDVLRRTGQDRRPIAVARLEDGAFFGETTLLADMPSDRAVVATRPSIILVAERAALDAVAAKHPVVAAELKAHCRRRLVANLGGVAPLLVAVPTEHRASLADHFQVQVFEKGERLLQRGDRPAGLHVIAAGEVAVVGRDEGEAVVLASLGPGETVGDVELVLVREAIADVVAVEATVTLFLPKPDFEALVESYPFVAQGLYLAATRKLAEASRALEGPTTTAENYVVAEAIEPTETTSTLPPATVRPEAIAEPTIATAPAPAVDATPTPTLQPAASPPVPPLPAASAPVPPLPAASAPVAPVPPLPAASAPAAPLPAASAPTPVPSSLVPIAVSPPPKPAGVPVRPIVAVMGLLVAGAAVSAGVSRPAVRDAAGGPSEIVQAAGSAAEAMVTTPVSVHPSADPPTQAPPHTDDRLPRSAGAAPSLISKAKTPALVVRHPSPATASAAPAPATSSAPSTTPADGDGFGGRE
jgi:CRP-like cAMP-binding protein